MRSYTKALFKIFYVGKKRQCLKFMVIKPVKYSYANVIYTCRESTVNSIYTVIRIAFRAHWMHDTVCVIMIRFLK